jgi:hypothetical protein
MAGTARSSNDRIVQLVGSNCTVADLLATAPEVTTGTVWFPAAAIQTYTSGTAAVFVRNAQGDYSWNRTAGGAETHYFISRFNLPTRTTSGKGIKVTGGRLSYALGVVAATTIDVTLDQVTYANASANVVATHGGVLTYDTNHDTNAERVTVAVHLLSFTLGTAAYVNSGSIALGMEATFVLANTGTLKVQGFGIDFTVFDLGA